MYTVYKHTNKFNNKVYIGITGQTPERRWGKNGNGYMSSPHFYSAIQKYGWNNFEHSILYTDLTKEEACQKEQELIQYFNATNREYGYNSTSGGEIFTMNQETREKISKALQGNKNGLGHSCSEEKKEKFDKPNQEEHFLKSTNRNSLKLLKNDTSHVQKKRKKN